MKVAILAGGLGTRLSEETSNRPKPMVEIGGRPILWHIMKIYSHFGLNEFVVALGYKASMVKDYFLSYHHQAHSLVVHTRTNTVELRDGAVEDWAVHLLDTGVETNTGGRVKQVSEYIGDETFMLTYGDGVADVPISDVLGFHRSHGRLATVCAVRPVARFGNLNLDGARVAHFEEKPQLGEGWINGGFFVLEPQVRHFIHSQDETFEDGALRRLAEAGELMAFQHSGFWQCMDTLRDVRMLERLWDSGTAPWKTW